MTRAAKIETGQLLRTVPWRDLTPMRPRDGVVECLHPVPWILTSWLLAANAWWLPATACAFMFFLTALRLNHEAIHGNLGFAPAGHRAVLHGLSVLMLGSNNAVAFNHLHHHKRVGQPDDLEGKCGTMRGWQVILFGPVFPVEMHIAAWRRGTRALRRRMAIDLSATMLVVTLALATGWAWLGFHIAMMVVAQCLTGFFAVWITHHDCEAEGLIAHTQRAPLINLVSYNMFFHLEHHLFPGVPVKRLARLAARIDAVRPDISKAARRVVPGWPG